MLGEKIIDALVKPRLKSLLAVKKDSYLDILTATEDLLGHTGMLVTNEKKK